MTPAPGVAAAARRLDDQDGATRQASSTEACHSEDRSRGDTGATGVAPASSRTGTRPASGDS